MLNHNLDVETWDSQYAEELADYSPSISHDASGHLVTPTGNAHPVVANQPVSPQDTGFNPSAHVPKPPDPAFGGRPGPGKRLGWSTGLRTSRAFRRRFNDESLHIETFNKVHPVEGPVGFSNRTNTLVYGSKVVLDGTGAPTNEQVTAMYSDPNFAAQVVAAQGTNPAYI